jgi:hypothetical protein
MLSETTELNDSLRDGPGKSDMSSRSSVSQGPSLDLFAGDPWNATCVLGLRVYSQHDVKIEVMKGSESRDDS